MGKLSINIPDDVHMALKLKSVQDNTSVTAMLLACAREILTVGSPTHVAPPEKVLDFPERELWHTVLDKVLNEIQQPSTGNALDAEDSRAIEIAENLGDAERATRLPERDNAAKTGNDKQPPGRRTG